MAAGRWRRVIRVVLVDDEDLVRLGLRVLVDRVPGMDGLATLRAIAAEPQLVTAV